MCLNSRTNLKPKSSGVGYKVFNKDVYGEILEFKFYGGIVKCGVWLKAKQKKVMYLNNKKSYLSGFHIFLRKEDAEKTYYGVLKKVKYRNARFIGLEEGDKVVIADEMFVPKN